MEEKNNVTKHEELENSQAEIKKTRKEEFDAILEKIKKMSEAIELHTNVKDAVFK